MAVDVHMKARSTLAPADSSVELDEMLDHLLGLLPHARGEAEAARARAGAMEQSALGADARPLVLLAFLGDVLAGQAAEHPWAAEEIERLVEETVRATALPRELAATTIFLRAVRDPRLLELSPPLAVAAQLGLFHALAPARAVSLWTMGPLEKPQCVFHLGDAALTRRTRLVARATLELADAEPEAGAGLVLGVPVLRWQRAHAALVLRATKEGRALAETLAQEAAAALAPVLEREALLTRNASRERLLVAASERRLARLGFDLHDGPMQGIVSLAGDLRLLRRELADPALGNRAELLRKVDGFELRLAGVDAELRELAQSLEPSSLVLGSLQDLLEREVDSFRAQTEMATQFEVNGDLNGLTPSQRIALIRIVQEALSNVREHSGATRVSVTVGLRRNHVWAEIEDDGHGFEVEKTLVRAARKGRLGLVGMGERARLLGGRFDVVSRPGGPTIVSVVFPPWKPIGLDASASVATTVPAGSN